MFQSTIKWANIEIRGFETKSIGGKVRRARLLYDLTLDELSKVSGISSPTLHEIETNRNKSLSRPTIVKLANVFPSELIYTGYYKFILNQSMYLQDVDVSYVAKQLNVIPSTVKRWQNEVYLVKEEYYLKMKELGITP